MNRLTQWTAIAIASSAISFPCQAVTLSFSTNRDNLNPDDQVNWARLGPIVPPSPFKVLPFSFTAASDKGLNVSVNIPPTGNPAITPPLVFQTTPGGIETNFAPGDSILFTGLDPSQFPAPGNPGPLSLTFATPVRAAGAQIAIDDTFNFDASISAYDQDNNLLGLFTAPGTSSLALDNSALFLGALSNRKIISRIEFTSTIPNRALGINALSLRTIAVPEPTSIAACLTAGIGLVLIQKRKTRKQR